MRNKNIKEFMKKQRPLVRLILKEDKILQNRLAQTYFETTKELIELNKERKELRKEIRKEIKSRISRGKSVKSLNRLLSASKYPFRIRRSRCLRM